MIAPLYILALLAFSLAAAMRIARWGEREWVSSAALVSTLSGVVALLVAIAMAWWQQGQFPLGSAGEALCLVAASIGVGTLVVAPRERGEMLSGVLASLAAVLLGVALLLPGSGGGSDPDLAKLFFPIHALATFVGMSSFALSFGVSLLFLVVRSRLKSKRLVGLKGLPSMDALDRLNTRCVAFGFLSLTLGIAAGGAWAAAVGAEAEGEGLGPVVWITLVLWAWYAVAVLVRVVGGWRGRLSAQLSVMGFAGMLLSLGAVVIITQGWHP